MGRQDLEHGSKGLLALLNDSSCFSVDGTGEGGCGKARQVLSSYPSSQDLPNSTTLPGACTMPMPGIRRAHPQ